MGKITTITTFSSPESLSVLLKKHFPLVESDYYTPEKNLGVYYFHVPFDEKSGFRAVICHFMSNEYRDRQNRILENSFLKHYGMNFLEAMSSIGVKVETKEL
jgi:hypothetical protein